MSDTTESQQSPFTKPAFLIAGIVIALIVVTGIVLAVVNSKSADSTAQPTSPAPTTPGATPTTTPTPEASGEASGSVCGLPGEVESGTVVRAPETKWEYQYVTAFPTSKFYGPGDKTSSGIRFCFQHSPEGAIYAAANALVQAVDQETTQEWLEQFLAQGPYREELLAPTSELDEKTNTAEDAGRIKIAGFRLLNYDEVSARVDIATIWSGRGQTSYSSFVYDLIWQDGDWKLDTNLAQPTNYSSIPDFAGYVPWQE